jgi:hypothetical protein
VFGIGPALGATFAWLTRGGVDSASDELNRAATWGLFVGGMSVTLWLGYWLHGG